MENNSIILTTKNTITQFTCPTCSKKYTRKKCYETHIKMCQMMQNTTQESSEIQEQIDELPSKIDMFKIIKSLVRKTNQLEREIKDLKSIVDKRIKNVNIIDFLNQQNKSDLTDFETWKKNINIDIKDIQFIFDNNFIDGLIHIITKLHHDNEKSCIRCFEQKKGALFIYENNKWSRWTESSFNDFISYIQKKIRNKFQEWQEANKEEILSDNSKIDYPDLVQKIMGNKLNKKQISSRLKTHLFSNLKENMQGFIL